MNHTKQTGRPHGRNGASSRPTGRHRGRRGPGGGSRRNGGRAGVREREAPRGPEVFDAAKYAGAPLPGGVFAKLLEPIRNALRVQGYETPTAIQERSIPEILNERDVLGSAQTGTGKTAAFVLPMLDLLVAGAREDRELGYEGEFRRARPHEPRALILAPTRELADQIDASIAEYGRFLPVTHAVVYGGVGYGPQIRRMQQGVDILVATPGRLRDLIEQGHIDLGHVEFFVLDEVDRMLDMGFIPEVRKILADIPEERQTLFFSATLSPKMRELAGSMVRQPVEIVIEPDSPAVDRINQRVYFVDVANKENLLHSLLAPQEGNGGRTAMKCLVFTQMKHTANKLSQRLESAGVRSTAIHGNKSQGARTKALEGFRSGQFSVLVATDVAARGIDVDNITHVINFDMPMDAETYIHRIGRTARAGADGDAISLCSAQDRALLVDVERILKRPVPVELEHAYHCDKARLSKMSAPKRGGGGNRGGKRQARTGGRKFGNARRRRG